MLFHITWGKYWYHCMLLTLNKNSILNGQNQSFMHFYYLASSKTDTNIGNIHMYNRENKKINIQQNLEPLDQNINIAREILCWITNTKHKNVNHVKLQLKKFEESLWKG